MFGTSSKDLDLLEKVINTIFDIFEGKRNLYNHKDKIFKDKKIENIHTIIKKRLDELMTKKEYDMLAIGELVLAFDQMEKGFFIQTDITAQSGELNTLATSMNTMSNQFSEKFQQMQDLLIDYASNNFTTKVEKDALQGDTGSLIEGLNELGNTISNMLGISLKNGIDLQSDAESLKQAVESLSTASNQQAASLEETAAAMEEMTSNVQSNAQKSNDMAVMATQTDESAKDGAALANRTFQAMNEIQNATNSINDTVAIIENIAFQTNILSLNAAVEAATAGDAGKGFAVVAQEVRNLANRSAEAAKEIKGLAEQAAAKSQEGTAIASELTKGFEVIADKIEKTSELVRDVSDAGREQMQGISQINTAITQLDQMTQQNAKIATEADSIANATIEKAELMVNDANSKNFVGKENIKSQVSHVKKQTSRVSQVAIKPVHVKKASNETNVKVASKNEDEVWESF